MHMNRIFIYFGLIGLLCACVSNRHDAKTIDWSDIDTGPTTNSPLDLYGRPSDGYGTDISDDTSHNIAVLLPLSGQNAPVGETIRASVMAAVLSNAPSNLSVSFFDTNSDDIKATFNQALETSPSVIIGPVFADNARTIRDIKPNDLPVLSFTSDASALGNGVITMALMPTNGVEATLREMSADKIKNFIIFAPDTQSGHLMAGAAKSASDTYNINLGGVYFYQESNTDSIKETAKSASLNDARTAAHTHARIVLSDILTNEQLNILEKSNLNNQLEKLSKTETIGAIPYDGILFLGNGGDTQTLVSFLRYYNVSANDARMYGTTMWDGSNLASDITMSGAKFATLPQTKTDFNTLYEQISGTTGNRLASFGYDATNIAIGMIYSSTTPTAYLFNPSGYIGTDGLFKIRPTGDNERALRILQLNASGTPIEIKPAAQTFFQPLYTTSPQDIEPIEAYDLETTGIDPDDYIQIPERFKSKYNSHPIGTNTKKSPTIQRSQIIAFLPDDDSTPIKSKDFKSIKSDTVKRSFIDEYEINE